MRAGLTEQMRTVIRVYLTANDLCWVQGTPEGTWEPPSTVTFETRRTCSYVRR
jgi:hypothetical protein